MNLFGGKPDSLGEVVRRVKAGEQKFDPSLREFLDSFYANGGSRHRAIEDRPYSIYAVHDAYVAAVAEHLARVYGLPIPEWSETHGNGLRERSLPVVCSLSKAYWFPRARRPSVDGCCSSAKTHYLEPDPIPVFRARPKRHFSGYFPDQPTFALAPDGIIRKSRFSFSQTARSSRSRVRRTFPESSRRPTLTVSKLSGCL